MKPARSAPKKKKPPAWQFQLFVADTTPRSLLAIRNLARICNEYMREGYSIRVVDIIKEPSEALANDVLATPMLKRILPGPPKTVIGTLSNADGVLRGLNLSELLLERPGTPIEPRILQSPGEA